ncbi:G-protein coupled receptor Mth2-like [Ischnura elegans]|uniref:G-protein coupled receptor Mth2-like n=1 Tax=Ischnura elegans TaxID=197161 RepID=UPI001ED886D0|nr:G-protein coupled receptor Mth2-like [Ischnura elegans]
MSRATSLTCSVVFLLVTTCTGHSSIVCSSWAAVNLTNGTIFHNGSAWDPDDNVLYPKGTYWTTSTNGRTYVYGCPCKLGRPCLRKCCKRDEAMNKTTQECVPYGKKWRWFRPKVSSDVSLTVRTAEIDHFRLLYGNTCLGYLLDPKQNLEDKFFLNFTDGTLSILPIKKTGIDNSGFCLEYLPEVDQYRPYVCLNENGSQDVCDSIREVTSPLGMSVSIFFLLISLAVYLTTSELRNLLGKCLICHIVSLLGSYVVKLISRAFREDLSSTSCKAIEFVVYFGLLSSFLWLNTISIDICLRFRHLRVRSDHIDQEGDSKKFIWFMLYAWGLPLLIVIITAPPALHPASADSFLAPEFRTICGSARGISRLAYFVIPMGIIIVLNIVLFSLTIYNIHKVTEETSILRGEGNVMTRADRERKQVFIRLMILMGVSWIFGSWLLELVNVVLRTESRCMWLFTDTMNTLQGFFVFIIFICKNNVRRLMRKKMRHLVTSMAPNAPMFLHNLAGVGEMSTSQSGS